MGSDVSSNGSFFSLDNPSALHVLALVVTTVVLLFMSLYYSKAMKKARDYKTIPRIAFLIFMLVQWVGRNTYQILGKSYKRAVPFFIYIMVLFWTSSILSIFGLESLGTILPIPAVLSVVVFIGTVISGIVHRGFRFFGDYVVWIKIKQKKIFPIIDPLKLIGELSKLLSLTFRLWGNTLAGSLILFVMYKFASVAFSASHTIDYLGPVLIPFFVFPLHIYFDIVDGALQPLIFMLLTMCYWAMARHGEGSSDKHYDKHPEEVIK